jgi:hypothetical protein
LRSLPQQASLLDYKSRLPGPYAHAFCGRPEHKDAECARCGRPFVQLLNLDARDPRLGLTSLPLARLPLLYCWGCHSGRASAFYLVNERNVAVLRRTAWRRAPQLPYRGYPTSFPAAPARLVTLPEEVQTHHRTLNRALERAGRGGKDEQAVARIPCHQVGGEPLLLAPWRTVMCPRCRKRMPFLAAIADDNLDPRGFSGEAHSQVIFHLCRACRVVGAYRQRT